MRFVQIGSATLALSMITVSSAHAIIIRDDIEDSDVVVDAATHPAFVDLFGPGDCIGTLVHPQYLLTVAHCATDLDAGAMLTIGEETRTVSSVRLHPRWNDADAYDIALVRLDAAVLSVEAVTVGPFRDEVGASVTLLGRGVHGTAIEGEKGAADDGQLRRVTNTVDAVDEHFLRLTMNRPDSDDVSEFEGVGAAGDSGGPVIWRREGIDYLVGLNSWGDSCDVGVGQYGASDYQTRVSSFKDWIDAEIAGQESDAGPTEGSRFAAAECGGCAVGGRGGAWGALVLLGLLGLRRRRA